MSWVPDFSGDGGSLLDFLGGGGGDNIDAGGGWSPGGGSGDMAQAGDNIDAGDGWSPGGGEVNPLSALQQVFLQGQHVPEVHADSTGSGAGDSPSDSPGGAHASWNAARDSQLANTQLGIGPASSQGPQGWLQKIMMGLGLSKDGTMDGVDLSDPKQLSQWLRLLTAGGGVLSAIMRAGKPGTGYKSPGQLMGDQPGGGALGQTWNPAQQASANGFFNSGATPWNQRGFALAQPGSVQQPGHRYAMGGGVGALSAIHGGQDDVIDAKLAPGEFVWDADTVSALGDGSNEAGAKKLEELRQAVREHKRSAPPDKIPPRAKPIHQYMRGVK